MKVASDTRDDLAPLCDETRARPMRLPYRGARDFRRVSDVYGASGSSLARIMNTAICSRVTLAFGQ